MTFRFPDINVRKKLDKFNKEKRIVEKENNYIQEMRKINQEGEYNKNFFEQLIIPKRNEYPEIDITYSRKLEQEILNKETEEDEEFYTRRLDEYINDRNEYEKGLLIEKYNEEKYEKIKPNIPNLPEYKNYEIKYYYTDGLNPYPDVSVYLQHV